ncbi:MAG: NUDIX hydrolase [Actinomycetota bacterium]|nr:NUDIX hydrolase [Actinomycetota bacterium]
MRAWAVGGGIIEVGGSVLMVHNRRRGGRTDWSTPGGVIDDGELVLQGLTREVVEETGLTVDSWHGPAYTVKAEAPDMDWNLTVEVHLANAHSGDIAIDDPDGIVIAAQWVPRTELRELLEGHETWLREPLLEHLEGAVAWGHEFSYTILGDRRSDLRVERH